MCIKLRFIPEEFVWQPELRPALPCVYGPIDYKEWREQLIQMDHLLQNGELEAEYIRLALAERPQRDAAACRRFARISALALRCNLLRKLTGLDYRELSVRMAESHLLQWFIGVNHLDRIKIPAKSTLERFDKWISAETLEIFNTHLVTAASGVQTRPQALKLHVPIDLDEVFFDATCIKSDLHFPTDWVLLRDETRTLMKATILIRDQDIKQRMPQEPEDFLRAMNRLAMAMSSVRRQTEAKKARKKILRQMKRLAKTIQTHATAHRDLLLADQKNAHPRFTPNRAACIIKRMDNIIAQLPAAIHQAHERIIGERTLPNDQKILSLYDPDHAIQVRGKAGAEVEFGNKLWLGELACGVIVDYKLLKASPADVTLLTPAINRLIKKGLKPKKVWSDKGIHSAKNEKILENQDIISGLCPRAPMSLSKRLETDPTFAEGLKRRGGTEARIAILKNCFVGKCCRAKGFKNRELAIGWAVLAHNLWVIARREIEEEKRITKAA
jgi:hypothetical protein